MDALRDESVRLGNFHVDSYCSPTRAALMTGRYAHRVGVWRTVISRNLLRDGEITMAEVFRHNGYRTGHFGKWHLGGNYPYRPIDRGFDEWVGHGDGGTGCATDYWGNDRVGDTCIRNGRKERIAGFEADVFFDEAMRFIRAAKDRPFFVYLATYNPHGPWSLPDRSWADPYRDKVPLRTAYFFASIARVDENLGRLRKLLTDDGLSNNTILIFLTDNGTSGGARVFNAGMRGQKGSQYDGGHRVPCFIHWPAGGLSKPVDVDRLTAHIDILPTLIDLCGLTLPRQVAFDGVSLKPLLDNPQGPWPDRTLVLGTPINKTDSPAPPQPWERSAVMTDRWRLVNRDELYDMASDPGQKTNVAQEHAEVARRLQAAYERYWASVSPWDAAWQGRPVLGSPHQEETYLCSETWSPTAGGCPWSQGSVAAGMALFGFWPVRVAEAGTYRIELRRWPREVDAPIAGIPSDGKTADAYLNDKPVEATLYAAQPRALAVAKARLKTGERLQEAQVAPEDKAKVFTVALEAGPVDIETWLLDEDGKLLCGAYFVYVRRET
jgi:arylsulfatase A-like enzyme